MQSPTSPKSDNDKSTRMQEQVDRQSEERRREERRLMECEGYVQLPAVGWYCRRLKPRRETDPF